MKRLAAIDRARAVPVLDRGQAQAPGCVWHPQDMETLSSVIVSYCRSCSRLLDFDSLRGIFANFGNFSASRHCRGRQNAGRRRPSAAAWPTTPLRKLVQTYRQLRARSARSWRHSIRRPYSGRISFGLLCTRSRRVASSAISNCCRSGTFVRATLFQSLCTICSCPPLPLTHHQCVFCMQRALQP